MAAETIKELKDKIDALDAKILELEAAGDSKAAQNKKDKRAAYKAALQIKQAKKNAETQKESATTKDAKREVDAALDQQIAEIKGALTKEESKQFGKYQSRKQQDGSDFAGIDFDKNIIGGTSVNDIFNGVVDLTKYTVNEYLENPELLLTGPIGFGQVIFGGLEAIGATPGGDKTAGITGPTPEDVDKDIKALEEEQARQSLLDERLKAIDFRSLYLAEGRAATRRGSKSKRREQPQGSGKPTLPTPSSAQLGGPSPLPGSTQTPINTVTNVFNDIMASINTSGLFGG